MKKIAISLLVTLVMFSCNTIENKPFIIIDIQSNETRFEGDYLITFESIETGKRHKDLFINVGQCIGDTITLRSK